MSVVQGVSLLQLPSEILLRILLYLPSRSLLNVRQVSKTLSYVANNELLWASLLRAEFPQAGIPFDLSDVQQYRSIFLSQYPYWFLARGKIWFSDEADTGRLILAKFTHESLVIEAFQVNGYPRNRESSQWPYKPNVMIHDFDSEVRINLFEPVFRVKNLTAIRKAVGDKNGLQEKLSSGSRSPRINLTSTTSPEHYHRTQELWPPKTIPSATRVSCGAIGNDVTLITSRKSRTTEKVSNDNFRMIDWSLIGEAQKESTWATLPLELYTPTKEKPYQGIFVGDYASHGCEFILVMQDLVPGTEYPSPQSEQICRLQKTEQVDGSIEAESQNLLSLPKRNIVAVKLTGDPVVPRGSYTFIADDIGSDGLVDHTTANNDPFKGARIVKSRGMVAERGFQNARFIPSQLILISSDKLAHYWVEAGHIALLKRVHIDTLQ